MQYDGLEYRDREGSTRVDLSAVENREVDAEGAREERTSWEHSVTLLPLYSIVDDALHSVGKLRHQKTSSRTVNRQWYIHLAARADV